MIRSMGPVDESRQVFTLDCYFRQFWIDSRLKFNSTGTGLDELPMNWQFLSRIWRPDTFFLNGKDSFLHKVAVPNRFIRISPEGRISYSQRLTVTATCAMDLKKFPLDRQACPLEIGSFGHDVNELVYHWSESAASMEKDTIELAQYLLVSWSVGQKNSSLRNGQHSVIFVTFNFQRVIGFYVLQVYVPLTIVVMSSWVSFWLVKYRMSHKNMEI
ncbi:gamma-aminobutyric acid receptor subunit alpha-5-like [Eurytemora carolleeae]|uniref:gamma-aminobutyric acid receptor subunit alpha-5-like n=1 Tax=Eurytemora carolleeae TaxID=1294199 RepID=UPI000C7732B2|nr:gamma-aminobutyric acid receptor subunit alpha-5-like [Eurytemora carolleeae]|eukprot:XP_023344881.1 gamma-aminobutyric acid receptor subunit alpha-5-like [Eurytemora affinis]